MLDKDKLKCARCGSDLNLSVPFDGCDWDSVKGEGSGFDYNISLDCSACGRTYAIGRLKSRFDFCENVEEARPYGKGGGL